MLQDGILKFLNGEMKWSKAQVSCVCSIDIDLSALPKVDVNIMVTLKLNLTRE